MVPIRRMSLFANQFVESGSTINEQPAITEQPVSANSQHDETFWARRTSNFMERNKLPPIASHHPEYIDVDDNDTAMDSREINWTEKDRKLATSYRMQIWKLFHKCLARTSIHGLPYLSLSVRSPLKITYWFGLIAIAIGLMIVSLVAVSLQYAERRTFLSSREVFPSELPFPAVTVCNMNSVRRSAIPASFTVQEMLFFLNSISAEPFLSAQVNVNAFVRRYDAVYNSSTAFLSNFGHRLEDMLLECVFDGEYCNISDFVTQETSLGTCYIFNSDGMRSTESYGYEHGLHLTMNVEEYEYFTAENDAIGFFVFIHNPGYIPYIGAYKVFTVPAGQTTLVGMTRTDYNLFKPPYGDCNDHVVLTLFDDYTRESCLMECETLSAVRYCDCKAEYMPGNFRTCSLNETVRCIIVHGSQFQPQQCDCPVPCHSIEYDTKLSYLAFPSSHFVDIVNTTAFLNTSARHIPDFLVSSSTINGSQVLYLNANASEEFFASNYQSFSIYFEAQAYVDVEEVAEYDAFQFFADFGGFIGFCIGAGWFI